MRVARERLRVSVAVVHAHGGCSLRHSGIVRVEKAVGSAILLLEAPGSPTESTRIPADRRSIEICRG